MNSSSGNAVEDLYSCNVWLDCLDGNGKDIEDRLAGVVSAVATLPEAYTKFQNALDETQWRLQNRFRRFVVRTFGFGSFITGLSLKNSDLDFYIEFDPSLGSSEDTLRILRKEFFKSEWRKFFSHVIFIPAKVPILRCNHVSGFQCDISAGNSLGCHNSHLIRFLLSFNVNFHSFFILAKFWLKRLGLLDMAHFKSYTLNLLLVFYLQSRDLLPSVYELQNHEWSPSPLLIYQWDCSYLINKNALHGYAERNQNTPVFNLLAEFFDFYAKFEFGFYVVSPYAGSALVKNTKISEQVNMRHCPQWQYDCSKYVCVQDIFQLDFNPAGIINKQTLVAFQKHCSNAAKVCESIGDNGSVSLKDLFPIEVKVSGKKKKRKMYTTECVTCMLGPINAEAGFDEQQQRSLWRDQQFNTIEHILAKVFNASFSRQDNGSFHCQITKSVFNRKLRQQAASEITEKQANKLLRDATITAAVLQMEIPELTEPVQFTVSSTLTSQPTRLHFTIEYGPDKEVTMTRHEIKQSISQELMHWLSHLSQYTVELQLSEVIGTGPDSDSGVHV